MWWIFRGLRDGVVTSRWPPHADDYFTQFRAAVAVRPTPGGAADSRHLPSLCPTGAITVDAAGGVRLDRGRCILCGRCVESRPDIFTWHEGSATAQLDRTRLVIGAVPDTDEAIDAVRESIRTRTRKLQRSVHIRHVDAGSDGSEEWEVQALTNPVYDVHRLGIFFTASPRHADILLVTGIGTEGMSAPLARTLTAMPNPTVIIAAGADPISGGLMGHGYTNGTGIGDQVPVDVWIPGSPPSPFSLLHGILLALGRLPNSARGEE